MEGGVPPIAGLGLFRGEFFRDCSLKVVAAFHEGLRGCTQELAEDLVAVSPASQPEFMGRSRW